MSSQQYVNKFTRSIDQATNKYQIAPLKCLPVIKPKSRYRTPATTSPNRFLPALGHRTQQIS